MIRFAECSFKKPGAESNRLENKEKRGWPGARRGRLDAAT
jgi:hypothetical protein